MTSIFDDVEKAVRQAEWTQRAVDMEAKAMAGLLRGRIRMMLRRHDDYQTHRIICDLKKELSAYNTRTGKWKDE